MANEVNPKQGAQENITGAVREYVGARYVPLFAEPITWDNTQTYEPLTIVVYQGNSYTSRQYVPTGIEITNTDYWALTGNYNAQIEQYRSEVSNLQTDFDEYKTTSSSEITDIKIVNVTQNSDIEELQTEVANLTTKTEKPLMMVFGDSYSIISENDTQYTWWTPVAAQLGVEVHNYATGGAGLLKVSNLLSTQVTTATNDTTYNKNSVSHVFIMSGCNDFTDTNITTEAVKSAAISLVQSIESIYPNAKIYWIMNGWPNSVHSANNKGQHRAYYAGLQQATFEIPFITFDFSGFLRLNTNWYNATLHPSEEGGKALGSGILNALFGISGINNIDTKLTNICQSGAFGTNVTIGNTKNLLQNNELFIQLSVNSGTNGITTGIKQFPKNNWNWDFAEWKLTVTTSTTKPIGEYTYTVDTDQCVLNLFEAAPANTNIYLNGVVKILGLGY